MPKKAATRRTARASEPDITDEQKKRRTALCEMWVDEVPEGAEEIMLEDAALRLLRAAEQAAHFLSNTYWDLDDGETTLDLRDTFIEALETKLQGATAEARRWFDRSVDMRAESRKG